MLLPVQTGELALKHGCVYSLQSQGLLKRFLDAVCLVVLLSLKLSNAACLSSPAPPPCVDACLRLSPARVCAAQFIGDGPWRLMYHPSGYP